MGDLISRKALINIFEERMHDDNVMCPIIKVLDVLEIVDDAPTVEAKEVVHAKWINGYCSNCGAYVPTDSRMDFIDENDCKFCYSCGCDMRTSAE